MFEWIRSRRHRKDDLPVQPRELDRDSAEDEYETQEEEASEVEPSGLTRVKTNKI
jgi:hypothetical protein